MSDVFDYQLELTREALAECDQAFGLSKAVRKAVRLARLRGDIDAIYSIETEQIPFENLRSSVRRLEAELSPNYTREAFESMKTSFGAAYLSERALPPSDDGSDGPSVCGASVAAIEEMVTDMTNALARPRAGTGEERSLLFQRLSATKSVYERIGHRVHSYLTKVEVALLQKRYTSDIFDRNRQFVDDSLGSFAPEVLDQIRAALERLEEGGTEAYSHALTSCRRCLKSLADRLYPVPSKSVTGADGKERTLTDNMFVNRLFQFVFERMRNTTSRDTLLEQVQQLGERIERLNAVSSKGVHADVAEPEATQCVLETYMVVGNLLRLHEGSSAASDPA